MKIHIAITILCLVLSNSSEIRAETGIICDTLSPMNGLNKIIFKSGKIYFLRGDFHTPSLVYIHRNKIEYHHLPVVGHYESFKSIPKVWDIGDSSLWAINNCDINSEAFFCTSVNSQLFSIPLKDTSIWNNSANINDKGYLFRLVFSYTVSPGALPIHAVFLENYGRDALQSRKNRQINFKTIKDSLAANTYFNFLLSSKKEPIYFLLTEGELSIWKIRKDSDGIYEWQIDRKYPLPKFVKFHCFEKGGKLYVLTDEGIIYHANKEKLEKIKQIAINNFDDQILIVDKDNDQVKLLNKNNLTSLENLEKEINAKSTSLF